MQVTKFPVNNNQRQIRNRAKIILSICKAKLGKTFIIRPKFHKVKIVLTQKMNTRNNTNMVDETVK